MLLLAAILMLGAVVLVKSIGGAMTTPDSVVQNIAKAIAVAEGYYESGSRPARNHNPGDMTEDLIGKSVGRDGIFVIYASDDDGWANLYAQIEKWLNGTSSHAGPSTTIAQVSQFYTTTDQTDWATNVANELGVSVDTRLGDITA